MQCPDCKRVFPIIEKKLNYTHGSGTYFASCPQKYTREERLANPARKSSCTGYTEFPTCKVDAEAYIEYIAKNPDKVVEDIQNILTGMDVISKEQP